MAQLNRLSPPSAWHWAGAVTVVLFVLRWHLSRLVGFGDAEALYACYALHPQPAYLDHPGLVGAVARLVGGGTAPTPLAAHGFTTVASAALPWLGAAAARGAGASRDASLRTFFTLALLPEISIGLFALTPDLPLAFLWIGALGFAAIALESEPASRVALISALGAGGFAGLAITAKASGVLLAGALILAFASKSARAHLRTPAPWCGLALIAMLAAPVVAWERAHGFPMFVHRFVATQGAAGVSLRNVGALLGGQLLYVTPPFLIGAWRVLRGLWARREDPVDRLLLLATVVPALPLAALCAWSKVAEPHWLAPAYLALAIGAARVDAPSARLVGACVATGVAAAALAWAAVATPLLATVQGRAYVPRYDLTNDLFAWRAAAPAVSDEVDAARVEGRSVVVVGPHWTVCAQIHAALGLTVPVGCRTPVGDDFSTWYPEREWSKAVTVLFVIDDRFPMDPHAAFPGRSVLGARSVRVYRGGRAVRTIRVTRLDRSAMATVVSASQKSRG